MVVAAMLVFGGVLLPSAARAQGADDGVGLTVYNQDFAVIREQRTMPIAAGRSRVMFKDVAATIVPESVQFRCLEPADAATVVEQNYEFDLVSADALLRKYIDRQVGVVTADGRLLEGTLMSYDDRQLVMQGGEGVELVPRGDNIRDIRFTELPEGLLTRPTLVWLVDAARGGDHRVEVAYRADRVNWNVDYRLVADQAGSQIDLNGWVTIDNRSGRTYADARLKLMAGDVHVVEEEKVVMMDRMLARREMALVEAAPAFEEKAFAEYHLYELPRPTTIRDNQTKQIQLLDVSGVPVERKYQYRGAGDRVHVMLEFKNAKETHEGLGIPLPKGPVRVFQRDTDGEAELVGSDEIDHTPRNEPVKVRLADAFDIRGERTQTDNRRPAERVNEQDWAVRIRNHKDEAVKVEIAESLQRTNWEIIRASHEYTRKDYMNVLFNVTVPADGEVRVTYTVRYTW